MANLTSQYNKRQDEYSATTSPLHLVHRIVTKVRELVPETFVVGIKLSTADYMDAHAADDAIAHEKQDQEDRSLRHVTEISSWGMIDFIEVSGGDYENPGAARVIFFTSL
jgi:2,4-dienoyl-CoA reductase-like NADH-dependent reductase (Old Yellow Enzyme family)